MRVLSLISILLTSTAAFAIPAPATPVVDIGARTFTPRKAMTNAYRLSHGLTPLPPKRRSAGTARRSTPSGTPPITKRTLIQVNKVSNGMLLGFVAKTTSGSHFYTPTESNAMGLAINVDAGATSASGIDIRIVDGSTSFPFLGIGFHPSNSNLVRTGGYSIGLFVATNQTPPGSRPIAVGNSNNVAETPLSESAVWNVNLANGALTHFWVNDDGTKAATTSFLFGNTWLYVTGDLATFNKLNSNRGEEVTFTLVEKP